jgi:hypothetical protein
MNNNRKYNTQNLKQFTSDWVHLPTKQIRVPEIYVNEVLEYAHKLDKNVVTNNSQDSLAQVKINAIIEKIETKQKGYKGNSATQLIKDVLNLME